MALFQSGNPTLSEKIFRKSLDDTFDGTMTVRGSITKFGFLLFMVLAGASYSWHAYMQQQTSLVRTTMLVGLFGGMVMAIVMIFKMSWARFLAPLYAVLEGLFLGGLSAIVNDMLAVKYPNIIMQAVGLTFGVAIAMFLLYNFRIIRPTEKFKSIVIGATMGIAFFYLITMVLRMFHVDMPFTYNSSPLGIGISLFIVAIAALNLIMDFDLLEQGEAMGAPKHMEWYGAFTLLVTLVWLYLEILKLLMRIGNSRN